jgi:Darcynin, domain of unknown function
MSNPASTSTPLAPMTMFMLVKTTNAWLALAPKERFAFLETTIQPILNKREDVRLRFFDAEAFSAQVTDVLVWETPALSDYQAVVEDLRETAFWGVYFEVVNIIPAIENAYASHYGVRPVTS